MTCPVSQTTLYIDFYGDIFPCYEYQSKNAIGNIVDKTLSQTIGTFQGDLNKAECIKCNMNEEVVTGSSLQSTHQAKYNLDNGCPTKLINLDLNLSNLCNFSCAMCNSYYSSKWGQRLKEENPVHRVNIEKLQDFLDGHLEHLRHVNFAGGEPFLSSENFDFLQWLTERAPCWQVEIAYNTNLSIFPDKYFSLWEQYETVNLNVSIDGLGAKGEFIRYGLQWDRFIRNLDKLLKHKPKNVLLNFHITVSSINIMSWVEVIEYLVQEKDIDPQYIDINMVEWPNNLCARYLDIDKKKYVEKLLNQEYKKYFMQRDSSLRSTMLINISKAKKYLQLDADQSFDIFTFTRNYEKKRNLNFLTTFPEWKRFNEK